MDEKNMHELLTKLVLRELQVPDVSECTKKSTDYVHPLYLQIKI